MFFKGYPPQQPGGYAPDPAGYADPGYGGDGGAKNFEFDDASIRRGFIRKVYAILSVSIAIQW